VEHCRFSASSRRAVTGRRNRLRSCHAICAHLPERRLILAGGPGRRAAGRDGAGRAAAVSAPGPRGKSSRPATTCEKLLTETAAAGRGASSGRVHGWPRELVAGRTTQW
jgi:hypothetical protein